MYSVPDIAAQSTYNNLGQLTRLRSHIDSVDIANFDYAYDDTGNIIRKTHTHRVADPCDAYIYDNLDRLTRTDYTNSENEQFVMDKLGNRSSVVKRDTSTESYTVDNLTNQYSQIDAALLTYDAGGNLTTDAQGYKYDYDYENRLITISDATDQVVAEFAYDAIGRRCKKIDYNGDPNSNAVTYYYYDTNYQVIAEKNASDTIQCHYVYGSTMDERLIMLTDAASYYYITDYLGSTVAMTNDDGIVLERYDYDAYGKPYFFDPNYVLFASQASSIGNNYLFTGRELDSLDNHQLQLGYHRNRYLHYAMARWLTPDPLGIVPNALVGNYIFDPSKLLENGINIYAYVNSRPVIWFDLMGLWHDDIHNIATRKWAVAVGYPNPAASAVGAADNAVDDVWSDKSWVPVKGNLGYHFNRNLSGGSDSRMEHYIEHVFQARIKCSDTVDNPSAAAKELGTALHPCQDWVAHGDYGINDPGTVITLHNQYSPQRDFGPPSGYPDNPDLDAVNGPNGRPAGLAMHWIFVNGDMSVRGYAIYEKGRQRYNLTESMTIYALTDFRNYVKNYGGCKCKKYFGIYP